TRSRTDLDELSNLLTNRGCDIIINNVPNQGTSREETSINPGVLQSFSQYEAQAKKLDAIRFYSNNNINTYKDNGCNKCSERQHIWCCEHHKRHVDLLMQNLKDLCQYDVLDRE